MVHVPEWLILSKILAVEQLVADVPFIATGVSTVPVALLLLSKRRINAMTSMILLSSFFSLIAALVDLVILIELSNSKDSSTDANTSPTGRIVREMFLSSALTLRFLFFWHFVALPARGETESIVTTYPPSQSFVPDMSDFHSGSWTQWGILGVFLKYFMLTAVVAVGVLESIWRMQNLFGFGDGGATIESASATLEIALSSLFILKLLGNLLFTTGRRSKMLVNQLPILFAMAISAGVGAGGLAIEVFMDYPIGRILQALEIYVLTLYILFLAFDDVGEPETPRPAIQEEKVRRERRVSAAESFSAVQAPSDDGFIFVSPNPGNSPIRESRRPSLLRPASGSAERLATWVSRRLSGRPSVPDLPYGVAGYRSSMASDALAMVQGKGEMESTTGTESIYSMYTSDDVQRLTGVVNQPVRAPRRSEAFVVPPSAPPLPKLKVSKFQGNVPSEPGASSPIYGLDGPVVDKRSRQPESSPVQERSAPKNKPTSTVTGTPSTISNPSFTSQDAPSAPIVATSMPTINEESPIASALNSTEKLAQVIEDFRSQALELPDPIINGTGNRSTVFSDMSSEPKSGGSPFSLNRFPLPPALPSGKSETATGREREASLRDSGVDSDLDLDAEFEFVPPRQLDPRMMSFPITTRGSDLSSVTQGLGTDARTSRSSKLLPDAYRYPGREITSFIGGASRENKDIADARAISRILSDPIAIPNSPRSSRQPPSSARKVSRFSIAPTSQTVSAPANASNSEKTPKPRVSIPNSLPANPRPSPRSSSAMSPSSLEPASSPRTRVTEPSRPILQQEPDIRALYNDPRPAPAPSANFV